jgi:hypothetical protein
MLFSSFREETVELPLSAAAYEAHLKKLIAGSKAGKKKVRKAVVDLSQSF